MADDESESDLFVSAREPPPRALTQVSPMVRRLVAPNASPFTFNGTCTYIVGRDRVAIVDPGPDDEAHLSALMAAVDGERVETILITHTHRDHSVGARKLQAATGARVVGAAPFIPRGDGSTGLDSAHDRDYAPDAHSRRRRALAGRWLHDGGDRHARPLLKPSLLRARGGKHPVFRRSRHGLVDVDRRAAGRFDARLHGLARQAARRARRRSIGPDMAARSSNRNGTCAR